MKLITENPYRTIGLLVGATAREKDRQVRRLKQFIEAEQEPDDDLSFPTIGHLQRTIDNVEEASSKLNLDIDKMNAALFWFYIGNPITDEPAFDALKEGDIDLVKNIWTKLTSNGELSKRNASAYNNLGTLYLSGILKGTYSIEVLFKKGISLKLNFLESDFIKDFKALATDETYKTTKKELQLLFLNQVLFEIEKSGVITSNKLIDILTNQEFSAKEDFFKGFIQKPIEQIEKQIEEVKKKRKANKGNAVNEGKSLYEKTSENLKQLKSLLGTSNLKFSSISDKVSDEILQCGIDYFSHYKESNTDPGSASMDLFRKAKVLAIGNIAKQRCIENTENLQEWIDDKPERDKQAKISVYFEKLKNLIEEYEVRSETVANGKQLLASARQHLNNVKSVLGNTDELYLLLSSRIASDAQGMCVSEINKLQDRISSAYDYTSKNILLKTLKDKVHEAWAITESIGLMDLNPGFRAQWQSNKNNLASLRNTLSSISTGSSTSSGASSGSSDSDMPEWVKIVGAIVIIIILIKACS